MATHSIAVSPIGVESFGTAHPPVKGQLPLGLFGLGQATTDPVEGGASFTYRMRGFDSNGAVNSTVYWNSSEADADASDYSGSAGPVVDIVIQRIVTA